MFESLRSIWWLCHNWLKIQNGAIQFLTFFQNINFSEKKVTDFRWYQCVGMFVTKILVFNVSQPDICWYKKRLPLVFFVADPNAIFQLVSRCTNNISNDFIALYSASRMSLLPKDTSLIRGTHDAWISKISPVQRRRKAKTITHLDKTFATVRRFHIRIVWPHDKITSNENIPVSIIAFYHVTAFLNCGLSTGVVQI